MNVTNVTNVINVMNVMNVPNVLNVKNVPKILINEQGSRFLNRGPCCDFLEFAYFHKRNADLTQPLTYNLYHYY